MILKLCIGMLATVSSLALAASAFAHDGSTTEPNQQSANAAASGDIVVTAQRRQERVTDVPISITVANQAQLERQQINSVSDLNRIAPSLEIQSGGNTSVGGGGAIRGIGTQTANLGAVGSVGIVVDQVSQGNANIADIFDVGRIEVLKGPQGTLFGLTTSAGVINITTNAPDPSGFSARVRTELSAEGVLGSGYGQQVVQGLVNIPVAAEAALRVSGQYTGRQGVNFNRADGDWDHSNRYAIRGRFLWRPSPAWTVNLIGDYSNQTNHGSDFFTFIQTQQPTTSQLATCGIVVREGNQDYCTTAPVLSRLKTYGASAQVDYDAGPFVVTYIGSVRANRGGPNSGSVYRADPIPTKVETSGLQRNTDLTTHELRVASSGKSMIDYTVGVFASDQDGHLTPERFQVYVTTPGGNFTVVNDPGSETQISDSSRAIFGQITLHATEQLRLIAGARYTNSKLSVDRNILAPAPGAPAKIAFSRSYDNISYRFGTQYDFGRDTMAYVTVARGFKSGQVAIPQFPLQPYFISSEVPTSYEAGVKTTLFSGLVMDLNVFYQTIKDFQGQQCLAVGANFQCLQVSIDGVKSRGAELNFFGRVSKALTLNTGLIYAKATYPSNYIGSDKTQIGGTQLAFSPRWKYTLSGEYETPLTGAANGFIAFDAIWKSRVRYEANSRLDTTFRPHWIVGGRVGVRGDQMRWSAAVFVRNLFNVHEPNVMISGLDQPGNVGALYGPQSFRNIGLQLEGRF